MASNPETPFIATVLAADRKSGEPVAKAAGVCCKAFTPISGRSMVLRVLDTLAESSQIQSTLLCGPPRESIEQLDELRQRIDSGALRWINNRATPSTSAYAALQSLPKAQPALVTTADHALLSTRVVDYFCSHAIASNYDVVVGLARHAEVTKAFPGIRKTVLKLRDDHYCGCNLYAFLSPESRRVADYWKAVENRRKTPSRVISALGPTTVLRYLTGMLALEDGLQRLSRRVGARIGAVVIPFPEAAIDVDTVADWELVDRHARAMDQAGSGEATAARAGPG